MELKAKLEKPYEEIDRLNFIIDYGAGHSELSYEIRETETALEAWGYTKEEEEQQEKEHIKHLTCTKRVLALMLQQLGISYNQLKELIATNEQAQLEWDLCVELERCNPLLDVFGEQLGISPEQIDQMFKYANGEVDNLLLPNNGTEEVE